MGFNLVYRGSTIRVGTREALIGRSAACKVVLNDETVSRRHARISEDDVVTRIEDLCSENGVIVNGEAVIGSRLLRDGDEIVIGSHLLTFRSDNERAPALHPAQAPRVDIDQLWDDVSKEAGAFVGGQRTRRRDRLAMLGAAAALDLAAGNLDAAERLLAKELQRILRRADAKLNLAVVQDCVHYALALHRQQSNVDWLDYTLRLLTKSAAALVPVLRKQLISKLSGQPARPQLQHYLSALRHSRDPRAAATLAALAGLKK